MHLIVHGTCGMQANCLRYTKFVACQWGSKTCRILGIADDFKIMGKSSASWDKWISQSWNRRQVMRNESAKVLLFLKSSASYVKWISQGPNVLEIVGKYRCLTLCCTLQMFCLLNSQMNVCEPNPNTTRSNFNR